MPKKTNKKAPTLEWNPQQIAVANLLSEDKTPYEIVAAIGVSNAIVSKVKKALQQGQTPNDLQLAAAMAAAENQAEEEQPATVKPDSPAIKTEPPAVKTASPAVKKAQQYTGNESWMKFIPTPVYCTLTPIMTSARFVAERELNWRKDMPWENFFDTCLYLLFESWGYILQAYGIKDEVKKGEAQGEAQGKPGENGEQAAQQEFLAGAIAKALLIVAQQGNQQEG